jgi:small subunit ribosomal protein S19
MSLKVSLRKDIWRGLSEEQLKSMSIEEFMKYVKARARRALKRRHLHPNYMKLIEKVRKLKEKGVNKPIKTHVRDAVIIPQWLGLTFLVYNGKEWKEVKITLDRLGRRLGEFSITTARVVHSGPGIGATRGSKFVAAK